MEEEKDSYFLPPRNQVHPTEKGKWTVWFYRILLILLICLTIGAAAWGIVHTT